MLYSNADENVLGFVRAFVFGIWFLAILFDPIQQLAELPIEIFEPVGLLSFLPDGFWEIALTENFLLGLKITLLVLLLLASLGTKFFQPIATFVALLLTLEQGIIRGFGFVNHKELAILYAVYILAIFPSADGFSLQKSKPKSQETYAFAMFFITSVILLAYSIIAIHRVTNAGFEIFEGESIRFYIAKLTFTGSLYENKFGILVLINEFLNSLVNFGFVLTTVLEILSPLCLFYKKIRWFWLVVIGVFHFATLFLMNIFFWQNLLLLIVLLTEISQNFITQKETSHPMVSSSSDEF